MQKQHCAKYVLVHENFITSLKLVQFPLLPMKTFGAHTETKNNIPSSEYQKKNNANFVSANSKRIRESNPHRNANDPLKETQCSVFPNARGNQTHF